MRSLCPVVRVQRFSVRVEGLPLQLIGNFVNDGSARFNANEAAMIVHSFSPSRKWFEDVAAFALMFGIVAQPDIPQLVTLKSGLKLRLGWATGNPAFPAA